MMMMPKPIPRWRFWLRYGWGVIFKSKHSPHNNLMIAYRPYAWAHKEKRWGISVVRYDHIKGYSPGTRMIVVDLGVNRCLSIHITPSNPP